MHKQSEDEMVIVRIHGPWGISRIKIHKSDSLADLKRCISERVEGLPRSSISISLFLDQHCSRLFDGDDSSTLRTLDVENGDIFYARPSSQVEQITSTSSSKDNNTSTANNNNNNKTMISSSINNDNKNSTSNLSNSRLLIPKDTTSEDFLASLTMHASLEPGENGAVRVIGGSLKIQANDSFSKTAQNLNRRYLVNNNNNTRDEKNSSGNNNSKYNMSSKYIDPTMNGEMIDVQGRSTYCSWGEYLKHRGWTANNNSSFSFDLEVIPKSQIIRRGGAPNKVPHPISLKKQTYRHVDYVEFFNLYEVNNFVSFWLNHGMLVQRVGLLYGRYENDENIDVGSTKIVIHGIYEPPQTVSDTGGVRLLHDPDEHNVTKITKAAGLDRVGWVFTHPPRNQAITAAEAHLMAKFQNAHLRVDDITGLKRSQFACLTITKNVAGHVVPRAFMVSDQGMVMDRSKMWAQSSNPYYCKVTEAVPGKILPAVKKTSAPEALKMFEPDLVLVPIPCGQIRIDPKQPATMAAQKYQTRQLFYHAKFPVENRTQFGEVQNENTIRTFLSQNSNQTMEQRVSDFHLLLCMSKLFTVDIAISIAKSIGEKSTLDDYCRACMNAFMEHKRI